MGRLVTWPSRTLTKIASMNTTGYTGQSLADVANLRQEISDATWRTEPPTSAGQAVVLRADSNGDARGGSGPPGGRVDELWLAVVYRCWQREHHGDAPDQFPVHQPRRSHRDRRRARRGRAGEIHCRPDR